MPTTIWAWYLGHHWGYRREAGEPQLTINFCKALSDFITNFTFGRGVTFRTPDETEGITPARLRRVWEVDNNKEALLWEIGQLGGVSGDVFVKVAYEEPWVDTIKRQHPGKVRLIPLNPAHCFPVEDTEILTARGWLSADELRTGDKALALDPETDEVVWADVEGVNILDWDGPVSRWENERFSAISTPDHRWIFDTKRGKRVIRTTAEIDQTAASGALVLAGGTPMCFAPVAKWSDEFVETVGWLVTEGALEPNSAAFVLHQTVEKNLPHLRRLAAHWRTQGALVTEACYDGRRYQWRYGADIGREFREVVGDKQLTPEFLCSLTYSQARLLYEALLRGDGSKQTTETPKGEFFYQKDLGRLDGYEMLVAMLGSRTAKSHDGDGQWTVTTYRNRHLWEKDLRKTQENYRGRVWCPTTSTGTWYVRRKEVGQQGSSGRSVCYMTGNCFP